MVSTRKAVLIGSLGLALLGLVVATVVLVYYGRMYSSKSPLRSVLPATATEVQEDYVDFGGDYTYLLRAKVTPGEFGAYVSKVGLTPHAASRVYSDDTMWLSWSSNDRRLAWWTPADSLADTFVHQDGRAWTYAKYEDGYLYAKSISH